MKADNKFFSRRLMGEAMRQVKLPGMIGVLLVSGIAFFSAIIKLFEVRENYSAMVLYNFMDLNPYIMLVMYIFAPLMVMMLFGFMNRRKASDFYHSLAYSRLCMYISFLMAVIVWCVIIMASGSLVTAGITAFSHNIRLDAGTAVLTVLSAIAGCVLTMSVTMLAMTLTGTYLTNVITAFLILFVPRGIMLVCSRLFRAAIPFVVLSGNTFMGNGSNIPFAFIEEVFGYSQSNDVLDMSKSIIPAVYSIVLGIIYTAIGAFCFVRRKSENATQASINRGLQSVLRMLPAIVISLVAVSELFDAHTSGSAMSDSAVFITVMAYVAAVAAYFLYEIITTRHIRKIYRTIPGLLVVFAVNLVLYFSLRFSYDYHISQSPDAQELEYVVVHGPENNVIWKDTDDEKLYSEAARSVASDCLKDTLSLWNYKRTDSKGFYSQFYTGSIVVEYHYADGKSITRKVIVNESRYAQLQRALTNENGFADNFGKSVFDDNNIRYYVGSLDADSDAAKNVYNVFIAELKTKGISKLFEIIDDRNSNDGLFQISFISRDGGRYSTAYIGLDMPLTLTAYINVLNEQYTGNECERFVSMLKEVKENSSNEQYDDGVYLSANMDFNLYTVSTDGSYERINTNCYVYENESYMSISTDKCMEYISELGTRLQAGNVSPSDIKPGLMLLCVQYYEDRYVDMVDYSGVDYSVSYTSNVMQSDVDYGWYIVDEVTAQLIRNISKEENIDIEK